jgi:Flp pilus assembly protein TadG
MSQSIIRPRRPLLARLLALDLLLDRRGTTAVEMGLIASPLLLFLFGIMECSRALWTQNALHYSVEEAARCASNNPTTCGSASQTAAFAAGRSGAGFATSVFTVTSASCGNNVSASYPMQLNIPFGNYSITLTAQACFPT